MPSFSTARRARYRARGARLGRHAAEHHMEGASPRVRDTMLAEQERFDGDERPSMASKEAINSGTDVRSCNSSSNGADSERVCDAFVFDLDGTLLDTLPDLAVVTNAALRECGYPEHTRDEIKSYVGNGIKALMYQAVPEDADPDAAERAMACWKRLHPVLEGRLTKPYPGIEDAIAQLRARGAKTAVLSNKFDEGVQQVIGEFMPTLFDVRHGECERIPRKPDPTGLLLTLSELGVEPARAAYVGDSPGDIAVARNAGTLALGVAWGYHDARELAKAGADAVLVNAAELLRYCR